MEELLEEAESSSHDPPSVHVSLPEAIELEANELVSLCCDELLESEVVL